MIGTLCRSDSLSIYSESDSLPIISKHRSQEQFLANRYHLFSLSEYHRAWEDRTVTSVFCALASHCSDDLQSLQECRRKILEEITV